MLVHQASPSYLIWCIFTYILWFIIFVIDKIFNLQHVKLVLIGYFYSNTFPVNSQNLWVLLLLLSRGVFSCNYINWYFPAKWFWFNFCFRIHRSVLFSLNIIRCFRLNMNQNEMIDMANGSLSEPSTSDNDLSGLGMGQFFDMVKILFI